MVQRICGLFLVSFFGLCATADARPLIEFTPEGIADLLYNDGWRITKAKCIAAWSEDGPKGTVRIGKFVLPVDVEGPPTLSMKEKDGKVDAVWERAATPAAKAGDEVQAVWQREKDKTAKPGDEVVLVYWPKYKQWFPTGLSVGQYEVVSKVPDSLDGGASRLLYWFPHRTSEDNFFRAMASQSLTHCAPDALFQVAGKIPVAELREGFDRATSLERRSYAIMLGVKGDPATDGLRFEQSIKKSLAGDELDADGVASLMFGYLQLEPVTGIALLQRELEKNPGRFDLRYATLQALRWSFAWKDSNLPRGEGLRLLHVMLDDPAFNDLVIRDLIRCKDWSQSSKLEELWDRPAENTRQFRRISTGYLLLAQKNGTPAESKQATDVLAKLRIKDAAGLQETETQARRMMQELWENQ